MRMSKGTILLIGGALAAGVSIAAAESKVYLAEYKYNDPKMYRMNLDGGSPEEITGLSASEWLPVGVAIDEANSKIYWLTGNYNNGRIRKADLGLDVSGSQLLLAGLSNPRGLDLDVAGGRMYWGDTQDNTVYRADVDGTNVEALATGSQPGRPTVDAVNGKVYYGDYDWQVIRRCNLDGSDNEIVITETGHATGIALDLASGKIYWTDSWNLHNYIARANLDNTGFEVLVDFGIASSGLQDLEIDFAAGKMYWSDDIDESQKGVSRADLDGSNLERIWESPTEWNPGAVTLLLEEVECPGDLDGDSDTDLADLATLLAAYGTSIGDPDYNPDADFDDSGTVDLSDLAFLLSDYGCGS